MEKNHSQTMNDKDKQIIPEPPETAEESALPTEESPAEAEAVSPELSEPESSYKEVQKQPLQAGAENAMASEEEDILFPMEEKTGQERKSPLIPLIRSALFIFLLAGVFLLGYGTRPEVFNRWVEVVQGWFAVGVEKARPLGEEMYQRTVEMVDKIHGPKEPSPPAKTPESAKKAPGRKIKYWRAPMNPDYVSDRPGKGPMGMDLIPVYEGEDDSVVLIDPVVVQNIGVKTKVARKRTINRTIRTVARLTYDERLIHHIHTKYQGWIEKLSVDFTGQEVNKGDLLMEVYSPDLVSTQEELVLALKYNETLKESPFQEIREGARRLLESTKRRLELFDVPQHQIKELIEMRAIRKTMHIHSPVKGFVVHKIAQQGMRVEPGKPLYTIADLSNIWVLADIYEYEMPWVKLGQEAEMTLAYFPGKTFKGKVTFIDPFLDPKSRTLKVRMEFANPNWQLKPEMYANVILKNEITKEGVVVPEEAVIYTGEKTILIVQRPKGGFESREVSLGVATEGYVQVLEGLEEGELVVTSSTFLIDSESRLKEALGKLGGERPSTQSKPGKKIILKEAPAPNYDSKAGSPGHP